MLRLEERPLWLTRNDPWCVTYGIGANNLPHKFRREQTVAVDMWHEKFISPHPEISLCHPKAICVTRTRGYCKEEKFLVFWGKFQINIIRTLLGYLTWKQLPFLRPKNPKRFLLVRETT
jgi:hypothetical protein